MADEFTAPNDSWVIGIDLGATKVALGLIGPSNQIVARTRFPTEPTAGPDAAVTRMATAIAELADRLPPGVPLAGVGVCSPGPLDVKTGVILDPPNLTGWRDVPLRDILSARVRLPVWLEHDAKAAAVGEYHYGAGRGATSMVYIVVGTGVGAAIILNGQLYRGQRSSAGEVGHITIDPRGDRCSCGAIGCVETFLSGPHLVRRYLAALAAAGREADASKVTGEYIMQQAQGQDTVAQMVFTQAGEALGIAVASMAMILDIERFVIGSSVARAGDLLLQPARNVLPCHCHASVACRVGILPTQLWDDGPILGCGWLIRQKLKTQHAHHA